MNYYIRFKKRIVGKDEKNFFSLSWKRGCLREKGDAVQEHPLW